MGRIITESRKIMVNAKRKNGNIQLAYNGKDKRVVLGDVPERLGEVMRNIYCVSEERAKEIYKDALKAYESYTDDNKLPLDSVIILATMFK